MTIIAGSIRWLIWADTWTAQRRGGCCCGDQHVYTVLVGANAAVVRSAIMGGLSIFARQVGRRQHGLNTLALTGAVMALFNPMILGDHGFQLSVAATLGLILYAQVFSEGFKSLIARRLSEATADRVTRPVGEYVLFTLAAQLVTLPVMAYHFNKISLVALIANPLILPAQPPVMILGGLAVLLGLVYYPLGQLAGYLALPFVTYTIHLVELFARIPVGELSLGEVSLPVVVLFFVLCIRLDACPFAAAGALHCLGRGSAPGGGGYPGGADLALGPGYTGRAAAPGFTGCKRGR
jgi:competence protein ComEC